MEVTITKNANTYMAKVAGRIDTTNAEQFQKDIAELMTATNANIEMDCSDLEYTSSQGLRIFLQLQKAVSANGGNLILTQMKPNVKEVFDITGFSSIMKITSSSNK